MLSLNQSCPQTLMWRCPQAWNILWCGARLTLRSSGFWWLTPSFSGAQSAQVRSLLGGALLLTSFFSCEVRPGRFAPVTWCRWVFCLWILDLLLLRQRNLSLLPASRRTLGLSSSARQNCRSSCNQVFPKSGLALLGRHLRDLSLIPILAFVFS